MDEIKEILIKIQSDLIQQDVKMRSMEENITRVINNNINEKFLEIEQNTNEIKQKVEEQEKRLDAMDRHSRRKNIIIFGIEETERSYNDIEQIILNFLNNNMEMKCQKLELDTIRRLGRKEENKLRPIVVTFSTLGRKIEVLKNKKILENTRYYIMEDFPPKVLEKRKQLKEEVSKHIKDGKKAFIKYDRVVILHNEKQNHKISTNSRQQKKRTLSESPEQPKTFESKKQAPKMNKISSFMTAKRKDCDNGNTPSLNKIQSPNSTNMQ